MAKFIEESFRGDYSYWRISGVECIQGMMRASGFRDVEVVYQGVCESSLNPHDSDHTVEGHYKEGRGMFKAVRKAS